MPYIGVQPGKGQFRKLTDISSSFNGSTTAFTLTVPPGGTANQVTPVSSYSLLISINNVIKNPGTDYTVSSNTITFSSAPTNGQTFWGVLMSDPLGQSNVPADGSVTTAKFANDAVTYAKMQDTSTNNRVLGAATAGTIGEVQVASDMLASGLSLAGKTTVASSLGTVSALTDGATITPNFNTANNFSVTLGGNRTLANPTNISAGQSGAIVVTQDGTGSRTLGYGGYWKFPGGTAPTLTTTASKVDVICYFCDTTTRLAANVLLNTGG